MKVHIVSERTVQNGTEMAKFNLENAAIRDGKRSKAMDGTVPEYCIDCWRSLEQHESDCQQCEARQQAERSRAHGQCETCDYDLGAMCGTRDIVDGELYAKIMDWLAAEDSDTTQCPGWKPKMRP